MQTQTRPYKELIEDAKSMTATGLNFLKAAIEATPDDKFDWRPTPDGRTIKEIVIHMALANGAFAGFLRGEQPDFEGGDPGMRRPEEKEPLTKDEALARLEASVITVIRVLEGMPEERVFSTIDFGFMQMPATMVMKLPMLHMCEHQGQINYIQTTYGDLEGHWPEQF